MTKRGLRDAEPPLSYSGALSLVHPAHATAARRSRSRLVFLLLDDDGFRREEKSGDRRRVLQRRARHLRRVDDARAHEVFIRVRERVVAEVLVLRATDLLDDDRAFTARVLHDHAERLLDGATHDVD